MTELISAIRRHRLELFVLTVGLFIAWAIWAARSALPVFIHRGHLAEPPAETATEEA